MVAHLLCARLGTGSVGNSNEGEQCRFKWHYVQNIHSAGNQNWRDDGEILQGLRKFLLPLLSHKLLAFSNVDLSQVCKPFLIAKQGFPSVN